MNNKRRRILFLGRFFPPVHGAAQVNENYFNSKKINDKYNLDKIKINYSIDLKELGTLNINKFLGIFSVMFRLINKLASFKPDLVYFEIATNGFAFYRDGLYALICKMFDKKIVFHIHSRNLDQNIFSRIVFKNTKMIILSESLYAEVKNLFNRDRVYILPNGYEDKISDKEFKKVLEIRRKKKKINLLYLSNMYESKGVLDALKICERIKKKGIVFECCFVGAWESVEIKEKWTNLRAKFNLEEECIYLGAKYDREKYDILAKTDFLVFPTKYENESFPLVILEAFMYGIPVFSYDNGAIRNMINQGFLGDVSKSKKWEDLAKMIGERIKTKSQGRKIREHFLKNHLLSYSEEKLINIFSKEIEQYG